MTCLFICICPKNCCCCSSKSADNCPLPLNCDLMHLATFWTRWTMTEEQRELLTMVTLCDNYSVAFYHNSLTKLPITPQSPLLFDAVNACSHLLPTGEQGEWVGVLGFTMVTPCDNYSLEFCHNSRDNWERSRIDNWWLPATPVWQFHTTKFFQGIVGHRWKNIKI